MKVAVIGANGFLGRALTATLAREGIPAIRASHHGAADIPLDFEKPFDGPVADMAGASHAVICSAISNIDRCFEHPAETGRFNVARTQALIAALHARDIVPVFCSSDVVFRGDRGAYGEYEAREPTTVYGQQKRAVEDYLLAGARPHLIVRLSKLYSTDETDTSPIRQTIARLRSGQRVLAATDAMICPTNVMDIAQGIVRLMAGGAAGPFHMGPPRDGWYTRYTLAMTLAARLNAENLVDACLSADLPVKDPRPRDCSLLNDRLRAQTGWQPRPFSADLDTVMPR
ncbi:MAG: sugar nucleotide-binding protein [Rhodospirillaceae bacterium]|nr:sugar nucleotide-binding protein [Rhodospirillaceae bacterium]